MTWTFCYCQIILFICMVPQNNSTTFHDNNPTAIFFFQVGIFLRRTLQFHFFLFRKTMKRTLTLSLLTSALIVGTIRNTSSFHFNFLAFRNHFLVSAYHINAFLLNNSHWKFPHWKGKMLESRITFVLKLLILLEYVCFGKI